MLDVLFIAMLQAVAGDPVVPPANEQPAPEVAATAEPAPAPDAAAEAPRSERVVCRRERVTGSRVRAERVCRTEAMSRDVSGAWRDLVNRSGAQPAELGVGGGP